MWTLKWESKIKSSCFQESIESILECRNSAKWKSTHRSKSEIDFQSNILLRHKRPLSGVGLNAFFIDFYILAEKINFLFEYDEAITHPRLKSKLKQTL